MPKFTYKAKNELGKTVEGSLVADSKSDLLSQLSDQQLIPISVEEDGQSSSGGAKSSKKQGGIQINFKKVKLLDILIVFNNLGTMLKAGLPILEAMQTLSENQKDKRLQETLEEIKYELENGKPLADSMKKYPKIFSKKMIAMIQIGEEAGNLDETVLMLADQLKKDYDMRKKVKGAMTYPIIVVTIMVLVGTFVIVKVLPQLTGFIEGIGELPATTKFLIGLSDFMQANLVYIIVAIVITVVAYKRAMKSSYSFRKSVHSVVLKIPKFGTVVQQILISQTCRSIGTLLHSGVPIIDALKIVEENTTNIPYQESITDFKKMISKGDSLGDAMTKYPKLYPSLVSRMVKVGDKTGNSSTMLLNTADFYDAEVEDFLDNISSIIEPILLVILGGGVLVLALGVVTPMYSIMQNISNAAK